MMKINVLGTEYTISRVDYGQDKFMTQNGCCGWCDSITKEIAILDLKTAPNYADEPETSIAAMEKQTVRHELMHAFLNESGLQGETISSDIPWAKNEEMIDWFAIQFPKILKAFEEADAM